ncbi:MAG: hypothetical protein AB7U29_06795 [Desulfobulbus sp.]
MGYGFGGRQQINFFDAGKREKLIPDEHQIQLRPNFDQFILFSGKMSAGTAPAVVCGLLRQPGSD